jgi:hypothetical protein
MTIDPMVAMARTYRWRMGSLLILRDRIDFSATVPRTGRARPGGRGWPRRPLLLARAVPVGTLAHPLHLAFAVEDELLDLLARRRIGRAGAPTP